MYENLVLELWYDVKKLFIVDARTYNSASWWKVNLVCCNATQYAPRKQTNAQTCLELRKHTASGTICHLCKLDGDSSVLYVVPK